MKVIKPLPEAYSRVTNPERFRPLHARALALVDRLHRDYQVILSEAFDQFAGLLQPFEHARPPMALTPMPPGAAPIAIAFTALPSLVVRCGQWFDTAFPVCACDACAATAEDETVRLEQLLGDVVAGQFREELHIPLFGDARLSWWLGSATAGDGHEAGGMTTVSRRRARALRAKGFSRVQWRPWLPRTP